GPRHHHHDGVAGGDDAAHGVYRRLQHDAVLRRTDVDAAELILRGDLALDELADLVVCLAQILGDLADHVLVDLDDLQFGFRDLAPRLRTGGDVLRALARQPGEVALQHRQARDLDQALLVEQAHADQFLLDQRDFLFLGLFLRRQPRDFLVELRHPLAQLRFLPGAAEHAHLEQLGFARHDVADIGVVGAISQHWGKLDRVEAALLGLQPRRARPQPVQRLDDDGEARLDHGLVEQHQHQRKADDQMPADRTVRAFQLGGHDFFAAPTSDTILIGGGDGARCSTWPSTVSFGPNACTRPSFSTRSWS